MKINGPAEKCDLKQFEYYVDYRDFISRSFMLALPACTTCLVFHDILDK